MLLELLFRLIVVYLMFGNLSEVVLCSFMIDDVYGK